MSTQTLKSVVQRGSMLGAVFALLVATILPASSVFADALNPLTERSLLLSSSAPGFMQSDGSGNTESSLNANGEYYAPPGSGPNGKKSGETFTFNVSTDSTVNNKEIDAMTFQYCTNAAGVCQAPGNNTGDASDLEADNTTARTPNRGADTASTSDLNVNYTSAVAGTDFDIYVDDANGVVDAGNTADSDESMSTDWVLSVSNVEDEEHTGALTGANNFITLSTTTGTPLEPTPGQQIKVVFKASATDYITNPGAGSFFVKINTYDSPTTTDHIPASPALTNTHIIDGGVTVANVMTDSIHITTKVLETMSFSVGTQNPDTQPGQHASCQNMNMPNNNRISLGDQNAEFSLETDTAYDNHSYWRLSSNSSGGATVYYSGNTLANTVGDAIDPIGAAVGNANDGAKAHSQPGTEQFGLALVDAGTDVLDGGTFPSNYITPNIAPLVIEADYADGDGTISDTTAANNAEFAFKKSSLTVPVVIAQNSDEVISCATSKVRYVANIAADTPAGVYTTKINYLAAPQY